MASPYSKSTPNNVDGIAPNNSESDPIKNEAGRAQLT